MNKRPELRLIEGEASPVKRFKSFVVSHSFEQDNAFETIRFGLFELADPSQIVPFDEVEFKVMATEGFLTYYIKLNRKDKDYPIYEVWCDDEPTEIGFRDEGMGPVPDDEAMDLVEKLEAAEQVGKLTLLLEF
jgi:hypothetical protein